MESNYSKEKKKQKKIYIQLNQFANYVFIYHLVRHIDCYWFTNAQISFIKKIKLFQILHLMPLIIY